jgi:large subunit ribosomal protein L13
MTMQYKTYVTKPAEVERSWHVVDAEGQTLGRLATQIATILRGKHKPIYSPSVDCGDFVIVVNAEKIHVTGRRLDQKKYYRHSGYMGGLTEITLREQLERYPERVIASAVRGMLPKNKLGRKMFKMLKVYAGPNHPHHAQKPEQLEL